MFVYVYSLVLRELRYATNKTSFKNWKNLFMLHKKDI